MDAFDVAKWERCKEIAIETGVIITVNETFLLTNKFTQSTLGKLDTLDEVYAYLCGYEARG